MTKGFKTIFILLILMFSLLIGANNSSATTLAGALNGRILLQVEQNGEAWYVNPTNNLRYYLGRPNDAFNIMRNLGLGISNKDFDSFRGYAPIRLLGRILLKVEDRGRAYYVNPDNLIMYYLGRPADAFNIMRESGLGITDKNLNLINIAGIIGWKTYTNNIRGFSFKYPENLSTNFIHAQAWPPSVNISTGAFSCYPTGEIVRPGELKIRKTTTKPMFCIESRNDTAAGTTYTDYSYTALYNSKLITFNFTIGYSNCGAYGDPAVCDQEKAKFDLDDLISQILYTFKFTN